MKITNDWQNKLNTVNVLELKSWDSFINFINAHEQTLKGCIYRGQRDPKWDLKPSFFREKPVEYDWEKLQNLAINIHLENFKKFTRGRHTISYTDPNDMDVNWWALGQHYGLETPLIDWVRSPYVASFFGFIEEGDEQSRAIFILDIGRIKQIVDDYIGDPPIKYSIELVDPLTHENKRLVSQQGMFTYINHYGYINIESYLKELQHSVKDKINGEVLLLKLTVPSDKRSQILNQLNLMNINRSTLFPDLSGSSEYCNYLLNNEVKDDL